MKTQDTDATVVELLANHAPAALEHLHQYAHLLEVVLMRRFGAHIVEEDRKDIVADTLLRAWATGDRFNPRLSSLKTWLIMQAMYQARDFLRRHKHDSGISLDAYDQDIDVSQVSDASTTESSDIGIAHLLTHLPARRAKVVEMYYDEEQPIAEIARLLVISEGAVRSHLCHARSELRRQLEPQ